MEKVFKPKDIMLAPQEGPEGEGGGEPPVERTGVEQAPSKTPSKGKEKKDKQKGKEGPEGQSGKPGDDKDGEKKPGKSGGNPSQPGKEPGDKEGDEPGEGPEGEPGEPGEGPEKPGDSKGMEGGGKSMKSHLDHIKDQLKGIVKKGSILSRILDSERNKGKTVFGSHDEKSGEMKKAGKKTGDEEKPDDMSPDDEKIYIDDQLKNLLDSEHEIHKGIEKQAKEGKKRGMGRSGAKGLSDIHIADKTRITHQQVMKLVNQWISKLKGAQDTETEYVLDARNKRVKGYWGEYQDVEPPESKDKVLLFIFDTSGSMSEVAKLMGEICSDIAIKMSRDGIVSKIALLNLDGTWGNSKIFEPIRGIYQSIRRLVRVSTDSYLTPAWKAIRKLIADEKRMFEEISGIIIVSDFMIGDMKVPSDIKKFNPSILALNLNSGDENALEFIRENPDVAIFGITVHEDNVKAINTIKVGKA